MTSQPTVQKTKPAASTAASEPTKPSSHHHTFRETVESIVIAFVLAFLFRTFEAEAFVIPTGSMAPTLQGRHKDLVCPECHFPYRVSASGEVDEQVQDWQRRLKSPRLSRDDKMRLESNIDGREVVAGTCPNCRFPMDIDPDTPAGTQWPAFNGDRILVAKFPYDFADPERFDVVVFRYPGDAKTNFIKRLIGLPNETVKIHHGDIYVKPEGKDEFEIVRKPPDKVQAIAQTVYDNNYIVDSMTKAGWPLRWQPDSAKQAGWKSDDDGRSYQIDEQANETWLRYRHYVPFEGDWDDLTSDRPLPEPPRPRLVTDFYAYNTGQPRQSRSPYQSGPDPAPTGLHWVGDLVLEATLDVQSKTGTVVLDLVRGGKHFQCEINVETGAAELKIAGVDDFHPTAETKIRGPGKYRVEFANVDRQLLLWVDRDLVEFKPSGNYGDLHNELPTRDDLAPAGIASRGAALKVENLLLKRDVYYIAVQDNASEPINDYEFHQHGESVWPAKDFIDFFASPNKWTPDSLFSWRRDVEFPLEEDQFFVLGDNSPFSKDSRLWSGGHGPEFYVRRELLIGKALFIYWPHSLDVRIPVLNIPIPFVPNLKKMGFVR